MNGTILIILDLIKNRKIFKPTLILIFRGVSTSEAYSEKIENGKNRMSKS